MDQPTAALRLFVQKVETFDDDTLKMFAQGELPCNPVLTDKLAKVATQELVRRARALVFATQHLNFDEN